ncbi:hypothetical protein PYW07_005229 [Mythimna separata]|uniref:Uncharacterized protein n=1 Tax=Mythimna separata TaxID=271217 RepID=A0AAD8DPS2_MYTSE|nr:hypothetical protein PYW07_005229 [Mythimna separata]
MAATAKTPKNVNSPKSGTTMTETEIPEEKKAAVKEIPFVHDEGFFQHDTGDTYEGEFEAKKKDLTVKMQGYGVYTTAEGDSYKGHWDADKLVATDVTVISFNDGSKYEGLVKDWTYSGHGNYTYPDGSVLAGEFVENCPVGYLVMTDPNGHIWLGKAEQGYGWFEPVNHFYEMLEPTQTKIKRIQKNISDVDEVDASHHAEISPSVESPHQRTVHIKESPTIVQPVLPAKSPTNAKASHSPKPKRK